MKLFFKKSGEGKPLIIMHGLFGLSDNWATLSKEFAENGFLVYAVDLRNHGRSPNSFDFSYELMAEDVSGLMQDENISQADFIGHSMGGKVAMFFALKYPAMINKLIVVDIAPKYYPQHHQSVFAALNSINLTTISSRNEVESLLKNSMSEEATIQFFLKNLTWKGDPENQKLQWRFGLHEIEKNIENIGVALPTDKKINVSALFIRGENSEYINTNDETEIKKIFPRSEIKTVMNAGHWVHAENPKGFMEITLKFLAAQNQ